MNITNSFFEQLSDYYYHENDLSNITVALCNSCPRFRDWFLRYFFADINTEDVDSIIREVPDDSDKGSRVDIYISMRSEDIPYLIEVKIYDNNHHFGQYEKAYQIPSSRLGYITNYELRRDGYDVKTWKGLYACLIKEVESWEQESTEYKFVKGYLEYLKNVCSITLFEKPMNLSGIFSLYQFFETAYGALTIAESNYSVAPYKHYNPVRGGRSQGFQLQDFYLDFTDGRRKRVYGWLSLYFNTPTPLITIAISLKHNNKLQTKHPDGLSFSAGKTFKKPYYGEDEQWNLSCVWFDIKDLDKFEACNDVEIQEKMLKAYIKEVMDYLSENS